MELNCQLFPLSFSLSSQLLALSEQEEKSLASLGKHRLSRIYKGKNNWSNYSHRALRDSLRKCIVSALSLIIIIKTSMTCFHRLRWFRTEQTSSQCGISLSLHVREKPRVRERERGNADASTEVKFKQRKLEHFIENCSRNWLHFLLLILCI